MCRYDDRTEHKGKNKKIKHIRKISIWKHKNELKENGEVQENISHSNKLMYTNSKISTKQENTGK